MSDKKASAIITRKKLAQLLSCSETTVWRRVKAGHLPPPVRLGTGAIGWLESDLVSWQESLPRSRTGL